MKCEEFEAYLADYLEGDLDSARTDAMLDHVEACSSCRAEFQAYQRQEERLRRYFGRETEKVVWTKDPVFEVPAVRRKRSAVSLKRVLWAAAAVFCIVLGYNLWLVYQRVVPQGERIVAHVGEVQGRVVVLEDDSVLVSGTPVRQGQRIKVPSGGYLSLVLPDKNIIEARGGSQLCLLDFPDRSEAAMRRGHIWVHLKTPPAKQFVIRTAHLTATAVGTVYGVEEALDRSVVEVAEGTVLVDSAGTQTNVAAGKSFTPGQGVAVATAGDSTDWSRYPENLDSLTLASDQEAPQVPPPLTVDLAQDVAGFAPSETIASASDSVSGDSPSTSRIPLVEFLPEKTLCFLDMRDWQGILQEFQSTDYSAVFREESLRQWWSGVGGGGMVDEFLKETQLSEVLEIARLVDGDLAVSVDKDGKVLLIAECGQNEERIRTLIQTLMAEDGVSTGSQFSDAAGEPHITVSAGCLIISSDSGLVSETTERLLHRNTTGFAESEFYKKLKGDTGNSRFIMAANLGGQIETLFDKLTATDQKPEVKSMFDLLGLPSLDYLVLSPSFAGGGMNQAMRLSFLPEGRYGAMNWLAEPAPMRGMDFFSPDVHFFASAIIRSPHQMLLDYLLFLERARPEKDFESAVEFAAMNEDFFKSFGGEIAVGLDSPILPIPNVKIAVEIANQPAFKDGLARLLRKIQESLEQSGRHMLVEEAPYKNYTVCCMLIDGIPIHPSWTLVDDFLVVGPGAEFVRNSIDVHESGRSIANDSRLVELLQANREMNYSLLVYQDIAKSIPSFVKEKIAPQVDNEDGHLIPNLDFLTNYRAAGIAYAYARPGCVDLYLNTPRGIDFNVGMALPLVANWLVPRTDIGQTLTKVAEATVRLEEMQAAVEAFRIENGRLPTSLSEVAQPVGKYIERIPADPFAYVAGETLRLITGPGEGWITIYSIGPDGEDNRGALEYNIAQRYDAPGDILIRIGGRESAEQNSE